MQEEEWQQPARGLWSRAVRTTPRGAPAVVDTERTMSPVALSSGGLPIVVVVT